MPRKAATPTNTCAGPARSRSRAAITALCSRRHVRPVQRLAAQHGPLAQHPIGLGAVGDRVLPHHAPVIARFLTIDGARDDLAGTTIIKFHDQCHLARGGGEAAPATRGLQVWRRHVQINNRGTQHQHIIPGLLGDRITSLAEFLGKHLAEFLGEGLPDAVHVGAADALARRALVALPVLAEGNRAIEQRHLVVARQGGTRASVEQLCLCIRHQFQTIVRDRRRLSRQGKRADEQGSASEHAREHRKVR